mgnify:CR=1 FL=1
MPVKTVLLSIKREATLNTLKLLIMKELMSISEWLLPTPTILDLPVSAQLPPSKLSGREQVPVLKTNHVILEKVTVTVMMNA